MSNVAKTPVVMQMEALECGAACLCMVLAYHGKWLPLEQVRSDCGVSRNGSNAMNILKAARNYGFLADAYKMEPEVLRDIPLPAIIHWNFNHFVVLNGFKKDKAVLNDPSKGTVEVSMQEFDKAFTGIVLQFEKGEQFKPEGKPKSVWEFARNRLKDSVPVLVLAMLISILTAIAGIITPLFSRIFMDNILSGQNPEWLIPFTLIMTGAVLFQFFLAAFQSLTWIRINARFAITANAEFMWHVLRLPVEFFAQRWAGDIAERQKSNETIASSITKKIAPVLVNSCLLILYLIIMIQYSLPLTIIGAAAALVNVMIMRLASKKMLDLNRIEQLSSGRLSGITMSAVEMIETIKAGGSENGFFQTWAGFFTSHHNVRVSISKQMQILNQLPIFIQQASGIAILMFGVHLILDGVFTIGMLLAFQGLMFSFLAPINQLISAGETFTTLRAEMERVEDVLKYPTDRDSIGPVVESNDYFGSGKLMGKLELRNITFGYNRLSGPLIKEFSLLLEPGATVAFVGGSGCGKSTIAKLITGIYRPWSGEILYDDKSPDKIDEYAMKSSLAMVDQDITLFEDTVSNNIRMWDESVEEFSVILAARNADIHNTIVSRTGGYDHIIKEGGKNFSGGQRQRMEIARVLANEPTVLVLDEATSSLDADTEKMVMQNIKDLGCTCIVVAHRLSTIRDCDEIIVMDKGIAVERGTHEELYANGGKYRELISME